MSKRMVVGLDGSAFGAAALDAAIERAKRSDGTIVGVAVIDRHGIEASEAGAGPGSGYFAGEMIDEKLAEAMERTREYLNEFAERCRTENVKYELAREEGIPFDAFVEHGRASDLILVGLKTHFRFATEAKPGNTVSRLLHHPVTPVLAVPEMWETPKRVLIAYNSSVHSSRAMRAFVHQQSIVPFAEEIMLLQIDEKDADDVTRHELNLAEKYLRAYGLKVERMSKQGKVSSLLVETARELSPCMVVMGAYHKNWLQELLTGSDADALIAEAKVPMFVFH